MKAGVSSSQKHIWSHIFSAAKIVHTSTSATLTESPFLLLQNSIKVHFWHYQNSPFLFFGTKKGSTKNGGWGADCKGRFADGILAVSVTDCCNVVDDGGGLLLLGDLEVLRSGV